MMEVMNSYESCQSSGRICASDAHVGAEDDRNRSRGPEIAGAALDVLPDEPPDPQLPILGLGDKVLLSPHMIANTINGGLKEAIPWVTKAVLDVLKGEVPRHVVNEEVLPLWRQKFAGKSLI